MKFTGAKFCFLLFSVILLSNASLSQSFNHDHEEVQRSQFPEGFLFGASTSSFQVEGAYLEDGKSLSNWDVFSHIPGNIQGNENADIAGDHYHRYLEDIELMHSLGLNAYRFSISWARILPDGMLGKINSKGIHFYNNVINHLLQKGIEPFVTIHHGDMPNILETDRGGWLNPLLREEFTHFASICFKSFGDRVKYWVTINEPNLVIDFAYIRGWHPPAHCSSSFGNCSTGDSLTEPLIAMHNMLIAHATAVDIYRRRFQPRQRGLVGIVANANMFEPLRDEERDRQAVKRALAFKVAWIFDPLVYGDYPTEMHNCQGLKLPRFSPQERELLRGSIDFIGINHYSTLYATDCIHSPCPSSSNHPIRGFLDTTGYRDGVPIGEPTAMPRLFIVPRGMENIIEYFKLRYKNMPMFVTENGYAPPSQENEQMEDLLQDGNRIRFHKAYLASLARAIRFANE